VYMAHCARSGMWSPAQRTRLALVLELEDNRDGNERSETVHFLLEAFIRDYNHKGQHSSRRRRRI
jgi:hypothetical protein